MRYVDNRKPTDILRKIQNMADVVKGDTEVSRKAMRIDEHVKDAREDEAREVAKKFFANGVSYEIVRASIDILSDKELQEIYHEVCGQ